MIVVGVDAHKRTHTLVAVDENGRILGERMVEARASGHSDAITWVRDTYGRDVTWGIEDCRQVSAGLERALVAAGEAVLRVPTIMMKRTRAAARSPGKSDSLDAAAVARAVLRESWLPPAAYDTRAQELKLLVDRRYRPRRPAHRDHQPAAVATARRRSGSCADAQRVSFLAGPHGAGRMARDPVRSDGRDRVR